MKHKDRNRIILLLIALFAVFGILVGSAAGAYVSTGQNNGYSAVGYYVNTGSSSSSSSSSTSSNSLYYSYDTKILKLTKAVYESVSKFTFKVKVFKDGKALKNAKVEFESLASDRKIKTVKTNSKGIATLTTKLKKNDYFSSGSATVWVRCQDKGVYAYGWVKVEPYSDLKVSKIKKKSNTYSVTVKNVGNVKSKKSKLGVYVDEKKVKTITVPAINPGKSKTVNVKLNKKYNKKTKKFKADYNDKVKELNENNNCKDSK